VALGKVDASPVISGNLVITASADGWLRILELATGKEVWTYEIGPAIFSTPAVIGNHIIVGADDGNIYMFGK
jgi:outer membrane protein assembly factor BamB